MKTQTTEESISLRRLRWVELTRFPATIKVPYFVYKGAIVLTPKECRILDKKKDYLLVKSGECPYCKSSFGTLAWVGTDLAYVCGGVSCLSKIPE